MSGELLPPDQQLLGVGSANQSDLSTQNLQEPACYKRGDRVFIDKDGQPMKAMVCEITPGKKRLKVAVNP